MREERPWTVSDDAGILVTQRFKSAEAALDLWNMVQREIGGWSTNARCTAPNCPRPALVPDGLCREHAIGRAEDEVRDYERGVNFYDPRDWAIERLYLIKEILSLGLSPADLEPTQEPPR